VEIRADLVGAFRPMAFGFVEPRHLRHVHPDRSARRVQHSLHPLVEVFRKEDLVVATAFTMKVAIWPDIADQWMSGSIGRRQRMVSRANSRKRRKLRIWSKSNPSSGLPTSTP